MNQFFQVELLFDHFGRQLIPQVDAPGGDGSEHKKQGGKKPLEFLDRIQSETGKTSYEIGNQP